MEPLEQGAMAYADLSAVKPAWTGALRARWPALLPLAAAAVLVLLLLAREGPPPPAVAVLEETAPGIQLEVSSGRPVAVIETEDADITVVWIF